MTGITARVRAALGAAMIVAFASPAAAQRPQAPVRTRAEAQWLENRGPGRQLVRWRMAHRRFAAVTWRRGYARGFAAGRAWYGGAGIHRAWARGYAPSRIYPGYRGYRALPLGARMRWRRVI